jgi:voltage-gated potassium channel
LLERTEHGLSRRIRLVRQRVYGILERETPGDRSAVLVHRLLVVLILCNVTGSVVDTVPWINAAYDRYFDAFEAFSLCIFSLEYVLRAWVARDNPLFRHRAPWRARLAWMKSTIGLIDLMAIAPFIVSQIFDIDLRVVVLLRLLRFFKIARYSPGFRSLLDALRAERHALGACLVILISVILVSAGLMYVIEHDAQPEKFGSIPDAIWWAAATVSTVGYGDVVPATALGRIVGVFTMITGLLMLALPAGIVATSFAGIITRHNFVVTASMVAHLPLFSGIDAPLLISLLPSISTRAFDRNTYIIHAGEFAGALHVVAEGKVEVHLGTDRMTIGPGGAFGGSMQDMQIAARAVSHVRLLVLEAREIEKLCERFPRLRNRIARLNRIPIRRNTKRSAKAEGGSEAKPAVGPDAKVTAKPAATAKRRTPGIG